MKHIRALISLMIAMALIVTMVFVLEEQDHECCGEHCSVCAILDSCPGSDNGTMLCSSISYADNVVPVIYGHKNDTVTVTGMHRISPVTEKVRIND